MGWSPHSSRNLSSAHFISRHLSQTMSFSTTIAHSLNMWSPTLTSPISALLSMCFTSNRSIRKRIHSVKRTATLLHSLSSSPQTGKVGFLICQWRSRWMSGLVAIMWSAGKCWWISTTSSSIKWSYTVIVQQRPSWRSKVAAPVTGLCSNPVPLLYSLSFHVCITLCIRVKVWSQQIACGQKKNLDKSSTYIPMK